MSPRALARRLAAVAALAAGAALCPRPARAALSLPPELDALAEPGFKLMYRHDFAGAEADFQKMTALHPENPSGYAFLCSLYWWQFSFDFSNPDPALQDKFFATARKGLDVAKAWGGKPGRQVEGDFWLGAIYGIIGRWHVSQFEFIRAYLNGNKGYKLLRSVVRRDPTLYEAYLGVGEFEYLAAKLPGVVRIPALLFIHGNRDEGLSYCALAAKKARYGTVEAKLFLAAVYSEHEHDYDAAYYWANSVVADDPDNPFFHIVRAIVVFYQRKFDAAAAELQDTAAALEKSPDDPARDMLPMAYYHLGAIALAQQRYEDAVAWFSKAIDMPKYSGQGWVTNCLLRRGEAYDLSGRRSLAVSDYDAVLDRRNFWDSRKLARDALQEPETYARVYQELFEKRWRPPEKKTVEAAVPASSPTAVTP